MNITRLKEAAFVLDPDPDLLDPDPDLLDPDPDRLDLDPDRLDLDPDLPGPRDLPDPLDLDADPVRDLEAAELVEVRVRRAEPELAVGRLRAPAGGFLLALAVLLALGRDVLPGAAVQVVAVGNIPQTPIERRPQERALPTTNVALDRSKRSIPA